MLLIYILITMLSCCFQMGQSGWLLLGANRCDQQFAVATARIITASYNADTDQGSEADFSDFTAALASDERFISVFFLAALALIFIMIVYLFNRYRSTKRFKAMTRVDTDDENVIVQYVSDHDNENEQSGLIHSYISTDSAPSILVAEDDDEIRTFITNTLRINYRVIAVRDGLKAFRKAFDTVPDLVITNAMMPGMDGVSLCHLLKATMATSHIPLIILNTEKERGPEGPVPADGCIRPDFDARSLLIEIRNFLDQRKHLYVAFRKQMSSGKPVEAFFSSEAAFVNKLNALLKSGFQKPAFGVEDLMEGLSLTKLQLFRKMKVLTNKTPGDYIRIFRVNEAKSMLKRENSRVNDIAVQVGFSNLSGFTKAFKDVTGITPVEYAVDARSFTDPVAD